MTRTIRAHRMPILCMEYDPTGTLVATGSSDRSVRVWDIIKGYCTHSFTVHTDIVKTVVFHPDPQRLQLFSTSDDNSIAMYDLRDQQCVAQFKDHFSLPTSLTFSPDGYILVSSGRDKVSCALNFPFHGHSIPCATMITCFPLTWIREYCSVAIYSHFHQLSACISLIRFGCRRL
jgi:WD40 repeat protein